MPIYEYLCNSCGHELETIQKFSDAPLTDCPECHKATLEKQLSLSAFHLKGDGWYVTDFRDKGKKPKDDTTTTSTDSKPAEEKASETKSVSEKKPTEKKDNAA